jgi:hypothetical protein
MPKHKYARQPNSAKGWKRMGACVLAVSLGLLPVWGYGVASAQETQPSPKNRPATPKSSVPAWTPAQEHEWCQYIGRFAGVVATDRDNGIPWESEVQTLQAQGLSHNKQTVFLEVIDTVYSHPDTSVAQARNAWINICHDRLAAPTARTR